MRTQLSCTRKTLFFTVWNDFRKSLISKTHIMLKSIAESYPPLGLAVLMKVGEPTAKKTIAWSSRSQLFIKIPQFKILKFRNIHRKELVLEPLFNKVAGRKTWNFIKKRLQYRCFPVKFANFLTTPSFTEHLRQLLLAFFLNKMKTHCCLTL